MPTRAISGALLILLPTVAIAQDFSANFWLARDQRSATDCIAFDPQFTREHTLTVRGGRATLTSPGGIQTSLKPVKPGVYEEDTVMDGLQLKLIADINTKTLTLSDKYIGCWWTAKWQ
ncbi:hypothetical protein SAMN02990966_00839 [Rhodospirillales bacterium URHD0017]|nr:hypothetical protein SAMN02990966_00839 [Rhodospirillales bacterium URHD0017]